MLWSFRFSWTILRYIPQIPLNWGVIFPEALNVNWLFLKLNRFICNWRLVFLYIAAGWGWLAYFGHIHQLQVGKVNADLLLHVHPNLRNVTLCKCRSLSIYLETLGNGCAQFKSPCLLSHFPLVCIMGLTLKQFTNEFKPHAHMHLVVTIFIIVNIAVLTLYSFIMSHQHATLILYYHTSIVTLQNSLIPCALWLPHAWY